MSKLRDAINKLSEVQKEKEKFVVEEYKKSEDFSKVAKDLEMSERYVKEIVKKHLKN